MAAAEELLTTAAPAASVASLSGMCGALSEVDAIGGLTVGELVSITSCGGVSGGGKEGAGLLHDAPLKSSVMQPCTRLCRKLF